MKQSTRALLFAAAGAAIAFAGTALGTARSAPPPQGTRVACVNLRRVLDKLQERQEFEMQLQAMVRQFEGERDARKKKFDAAAKDVSAMPEGPERQTKVEAIILEQFEFEQWGNARLGDLDLERSLMWRNIYRNMRSEAAKLAENEGYDFVMMDDGSDDITVSRDVKMPLEQQAVMELQRRHMLFASPANDLTDKLIVRMNNARAAGEQPSTPPAGGAK